MMKNILKALLTMSIIMLSAAALTMTAYAEDYKFEISEPFQSSGNWDLAFIHETANARNFPENFDATWMTPESEVIVEYTYEGKCSNAPLELIWQTWNGPVPKDPDVKKNWNRVSPYEYDEKSAKFSFKDIAESYGTENFSTVYAINIGDRGVKLTVTGVTVTNCSINGTGSEAQTEPPAQTETEIQTDAEALTEADDAEAIPETEAESKKESSSPVTEALSETEPVTESGYEEKDSGAGAVITVVIVFVIIVGMTAAAYLSKKKKRRNRYY